METPYWQVNVSEDKRTVECPAFLQALSAKDKGIISTPQADYRFMTWPELRDIVAKNDLGRLQRDPVALRRYLEYAWGLKKEYGGVVDFVLQKRLRWNAADLTQTATTEQTIAELEDAMKKGPSASPDARVRILCNDWPYGIDKRVVHLVVWTKFGLADDPATGDVTDGTRAAIDAYVKPVFGELGPDNYIWFKNWKSLKSVLLVEHFHVMLLDPPSEFVTRVTGGDIAFSKHLQRPASEVQ